MNDTSDSRTSDSQERRYGHTSGSGANEPKHSEKKEQHENWIHRQGGDQTRSEEPESSGGEDQSIGDEPIGGGPGPGHEPIGGAGAVFEE